MGKGDKKSRRGKIIIGTFGVRRRRKKDGKPDIKPTVAASVKEVKEKKPVKEKAEVKELKAVSRKLRPPKKKQLQRHQKLSKRKKRLLILLLSQNLKKRRRVNQKNGNSF